MRKELLVYFFKYREYYFIINKFNSHESSYVFEKEEREGRDGKTERSREREREMFLIAQTIPV